MYLLTMITLKCGYYSEEVRTQTDGRIQWTAEDGVGMHEHMYMYM